MDITQIDIEKNEERVKDFRRERKNKLERHFSSLSQLVLKNITEVVIAILLVLRIPRGWYGRLTVSGIARCMRGQSYSCGNGPAFSLSGSCLCVVDYHGGQ